MSTRLSSARVLLFGLFALSPVIPACSSGGGGGAGSSALFVESFDVAGRTDVERNRPLVVTFNSPIDPATLNVAGFQIRSGSSIYQGRVEVDGRVVRFFPTVFPGDRNDYSPDNSPQVNGIGFPPVTKFQIVILANSPLSVRNRRGHAMTQTFTGNFTTGSAFLPENPPVFPRLAELPTFNQIPRNAASGPDPRDPLTAPEFDPSNLRVTLRFTEVMDPDKFNPFLTMSIANVTPGFPGAGLPTLGNVVPSPDGTSFTFTPLFTLGDNPGTPEPFMFRLRLNGLLATNPTDPRALSDLAGNPLEGNPDVDGGSGLLFAPIDFFFKTVDKEGEPNFGSFTDDFVDNRNRGGSFDDPTTAIWPSAGFLEGSAATRSTVTVDPTDSGFLLPQPLTTEGNRMQFIFNKEPDFSGIGLASLIGWEWGPRSNFVFASNYRGVTVAVGHTMKGIFTDGLAFRFQENFGGFPNNPTTIFSGTYSVPNSLTSSYFPWPEFQTDFEYNGVNNVCLEVNVPPGGETFQLFRSNSTACVPRRRIYGAAGADQAVAGENTIYHSRFSFIRKKSFGVSRLIDTQTSNPDYTEPLVIADTLRIGATYVLTFSAEDEGAGGSADGNRVGPFADVNRIDGKRFFIFRFALNADPFTGVIPRIDSISLGWRIE